MTKPVISARVPLQDWVDFHYRVTQMKPKRTASERIQQLIQADLKRWRKGTKK